MEFFTSAVGTLKVLVIALGAGLGVWGVINLRYHNTETIGLVSFICYKETINRDAVSR